jgi:dephospho-CoA kinase
MIVGITGGIGSGKSYVCKIFAQLFIPVYDADSKAKELINSDAELINGLKKLFGNDLYDNQNRLDKKKLASLIFSDDDKLKKANALIHPVVANDFDKWAKQNTYVPYVIEESAILFEAGVDKKCKYTISVSCPEEIRINRVLKRDETTKEKIQAIIKNQLSDEERNRRASFVLMNDESIPLLEEILKLHKYFMESSVKKNGI